MVNKLYLAAIEIEQEGRVNKRSIKHHPSTLQGGEDYMVNKLYLAAIEMDKLINKDRKIEMEHCDRPIVFKPYFGP